jgi:RNA polymerase sigma factor (sigma-70 family)
MTSRGLEEATAVSRRLPGDFREFFREQYPRLCRGLFLLAGSPDEAEDVAQEAMTRVYERWDRVAGMDSPTGYLWQTAVNLNRKRQRRTLLGRRVIPPVVVDRDPSAIAATGVDVRDALVRLSVDHREALVLVDWLELDAVSAAAVLRIEPASVRSRVHRARERMRALLEGEP